MNDAYDSVVTYISRRYGIFSKALSGISLILFPPSNLKKKQYNLHLFYVFNQLKIVQLRWGVCVWGGGMEVGEGNLYFNLA